MPKFRCTAFGLALLAAWLSVGVLHVDDFEEPSNHFFLKKVATFRVIFSDPYLSRMQDNGEYLPNSPELNDYLAFCNARYGITISDPIVARTKCRAMRSPLKDTDMRPTDPR